MQRRSHHILIKPGQVLGRVHRGHGQFQTGTVVIIQHMCQQNLHLFLCIKSGGERRIICRISQLAKIAVMLQQPLIKPIDLLRRRRLQMTGNRPLPGAQFTGEIVVGKTMVVVRTINPDHHLGQQAMGAEAKHRSHELHMMTMVDLHHFHR